MPTVCKITLDATEYRRELAAVVAESREAAGNLSNLPDKKVSVTADTRQAKDAVEELAKTAQEEINVPVTTDPAPLETAQDALQQTDVSARKTGGILSKLIPESLRSKAVEAFGAIRDEMNKTQGGAGKFLETFLAGGGAIGILVGGVLGLGKVVSTVYNNWINGMKDAGELAQQNAESIRETAEANEQVRQKTDGYLSRLSELSTAEQLSNSNKAEALKLISDLRKSYGDLGIVLDETTGKLSGVDEAMVKKLQRDKDQRIRELETELKQLQSDNAAQADVRDNAGVKVWGFRGQKGGFFSELTFGGEADIKEAGQKIAENAKRMMELRRQLGELRRTDSVADYRAKRQAENEDLADAYRERQSSFEQSKSDEAFSTALDFDTKLANRRQAIDAERNGRKRAEAFAALESAQTDYQKATNTGNQDGMLDAEKRMVLQKRNVVPGERRRLAGLSQHRIPCRIGSFTEQIRQEFRDKRSGDFGKGELRPAGKSDVENRFFGTEPDAADFHEFSGRLVPPEPFPDRVACIFRAGADGTACHTQIQDGGLRIVTAQSGGERFVFRRHGCLLDSAVSQRCQQQGSENFPFAAHSRTPSSMVLRFLHSSRTASIFSSESMPA